MRKKSGFTLIELMSGNAASAFFPKSSNENRIKRQGFTLIELMIVIAIIAILASILVPNFAKSRGKATLKACESNLRTIAIAMELYAADHGKCWPGNPNWFDVFYPSAGTCYLYPDYLKAIPTCPAGANSRFSYRIVTGSTYQLAGNSYFIQCYQDTPYTSRHEGIDNSTGYFKPQYHSNGFIKEKE